jgi:hypothetical protein
MITDSVLVQTYMAAMRHWDAQKSDGVSLCERLIGLEKTLRACWPFTREWKYLCVECSDFGLVMATCPGDATCGRSKQHLPHDYGTPCWCSQGIRYRAKPKPSADDFTAAGKSKPMTRLGR